MRLRTRAPYRFFVCLALIVCCAVPGEGQPALDDSGKLAPEIEKFIAYMAQTHGFSVRDLRVLFAKVQPSPDVTRAMAAPSTAKPWYEFKPLFVDQARIVGGVRFWNENGQILSQARADFGVPEGIIVALIGVETRYGRHTGGYRVLDTLTLLAFDWPSRRDFFRRELEQFLLLAREQGWDPLAIKGSFAGAMGVPQFMPGSYRRYAIDYNKDGQIDLWRNPADVIGSVANYLKEFGWKDGEPVVAPARVETSERQALLDMGLKPSLTLEGQIAPWSCRTRCPPAYFQSISSAAPSSGSASTTFTPCCSTTAAATMRWRSSSWHARSRPSGNDLAHYRPRWRNSCAQRQRMSQAARPRGRSLITPRPSAVF
jgi:membrane-bound lytic murein transglycosylase B